MLGNNPDWLIKEMDKIANPRNWERVVCAAIHYNDGKPHAHQPINIDTGFVICGLRHHNCISVFSELGGCKTLNKNSVQGFVTTKNRFVNRMEAMDVAINSGQVQERNLKADHIGLFSEDLY